MTTQKTRSSRLGSLLSKRSIKITLVAYSAAVAISYWLGANGLPGVRPSLEDMPVFTQLVVVPVLFAVVYLPTFLAVTYAITRNRRAPDLASRAPERSVARSEILMLLAYGFAMLVLGQFIGRAFWGEGIGFHLHGSLFGATVDVTGDQVLAWVAYNFLAYAVIPYLFFRRRGYDHDAMNLRSSNRKNDIKVVLAIVALGVPVDLLNGNLFDLTGQQLLIGVPVSLGVHLFGTALPTLMFLTIVLPRYLKLTESVTTTVILGGLTYAGLHIFEYWAGYDSLTNSALSLTLVFLQFFVPGVIKSFLTLRTGNAWVHLWGYHVISPHLAGDTPIIVKYFGIK